MALTLPVNFSKDIEGRETALVPVIRFRDASGSNPIYISTVSETIGNNQWLPLLLDIPKITQKVDLSTGKYQTSSV